MAESNDASCPMDIPNADEDPNFATCSMDSGLCDMSSVNSTGNAPLPLPHNGLNPPGSGIGSLSEAVAGYMARRQEEAELEAEEAEAAGDGAAAGDSLASELEAKDRDLMMAAQLGQALLTSNQELARRNELLVEEFQQKIWELEQEKQSLKLRLDAAESDYDAHVRDLQRDIVSLRGEVQRQAAAAREGERDRGAKEQELSSQNDRLTEALNTSYENERQLSATLHSAQEELRQRRQSMQEHMHQIEVMREEIGDLRSRKMELENRLASLSEERDGLLSAAEEQADRLKLMEKVAREQQVALADQAAEIEDLTETAQSLQERLECLSLSGAHSQQQVYGIPAGVPLDCSAGMSQNGAGSAESLLMELHSSSSRPMSLLLPSCPELSLLGTEEEECEVDDDDFILRSTMSDLSSPPELPLDTYYHCEEGAGLTAQSTYMGELRAEVLEVYHQLRRMCAALARRRERPGDVGAPIQTPDELALVEMDFRLGSLREVLADLKALLRDIVALGEVTSVSAIDEDGSGVVVDTAGDAVSLESTHTLAMEEDRLGQLRALRDQVEAKDAELQEKQAALDQVNQELALCQMALQNQEANANVIDSSSSNHISASHPSASNDRNSYESLGQELEALGEQIVAALTQND